MLGNTFGRLFRVTTCGESYSGAFRKNPNIPPELWGGLAVIVDGVPAGLKVTSQIIQEELDKRTWTVSASHSKSGSGQSIYFFRSNAG